MKIRNWKLIGLFILLCTCFYGCGKQSSTLSGEDFTSVTVWHYYSGTQKEAFDNLISRFNDTVGNENGIVVTTEAKGDVTELIAAVTDSAAGKVGSAVLPDVFATYVDTAYTLYQDDLLVNIREYMKEEELDSYVPAFIEEGELVPSELYVMPVAKSTELLYLNETDWNLFAEAEGVSLDELSTWEGLARVSEQYYQWSQGKAFFGRDAFANYLIIGSHQLGADIFQVTDGQVTVQLDEAIMRRLWDNYAVPYIRGYYGAYGRFRSDDVKTGDLVSCVASSTSISYYPNEITKEDGTTYPIEMKVLSLPDFEGTDAVCVQQGAGMAVVKSDEKKEKAAVEFLKWFTDVEQNTDFCVQSAYMPVKTESNTSGQMEAALKNAEVTDTLIYDNLMMGAEAINSKELYTTPPFDQGNSFRGILTEYTTEHLDVYKEQFKAIEDGEAEEALESFFQQWLSGLKTDLNP